jgi:hypothetical protein
MHSGQGLREGARPEVVRDILGHANIDVTQNVYGKSWAASHRCSLSPWITPPPSVALLDMPQNSLCFLFA